MIFLQFFFQIPSSFGSTRCVLQNTLVMIQINTQVKNLNNDITHMNTARNYLHESISDLEKVIGDLEIEQRRLVTKQSTVLTQIMESEYALKEKNMLNEEQTQKLEKLKKKVNKSH